MPQKTLGRATPDAPLPREPVPPSLARNRVLAAILLPLAAVLLLGVVTGSLFVRAGQVGQASAAPVFAALGLTSWFIGLRLYGLRGMALRGGRPLFAGIGFAVLAWVAVLIGRFLPGLPQTTINPDGQAVVTLRLLVEVVATRSEGAGRAFAYLLLFEAFAVQLWSSVAVLALAPMQDFLALGTEARMNYPGRASGNWQWRMPADAINDGLIERIREENYLNNRLLGVDKQPPPRTPIAYSDAE